MFAMADEDPKHEIIPRQEARTRGLRHYFTGRPCKRGHASRRLVSTSQCMDCLRLGLASRRAKNLEAFRERDRVWRDANRERVQEQSRARYAKDPRRFVEKSTRYYALNCEEVKRKQRERHHQNYADAEVRLAAQERTRQWAKAHPDQARTNARNSKAKRKNVTGAHTAADIEAIRKAQKGRCAYCRVRLRKRHHVDHIKPVSKGGANNRKNLQLLCAPCNLQKGARDPLDYGRWLGRLL